MSAGLILAGLLEGVGGVNRAFGNRQKTKELQNRGVNVPFHQKAFNLALGPVIGGRLQQASLERKLERTDPGIPTRNSIGLAGDEAFASSAKVFREMLSRQMGTEITNINREFSSSGRFDSGQRLQAVQEAQQGSRQQFGNFLASTALERFLQQQRLQTQADISQAQIEAQQGTGRSQLFGQGVGAVANIFAQNPEWLRSLYNKGFGENDAFLNANPGFSKVG